ncbi:MAG: metalloregulator ArsR/SmtB family transcription factor [Candidatus Bathyarchaeia archaeon]
MTYFGVPRQKIPWFPTIAQDKCQGCGKCVEFCVHGVLKLKGNPPKAVVVKPYQCVIACSECADLCPEKAITFPDLKVVYDAMDQYWKGESQKEVHRVKKKRALSSSIRNEKFLNLQVDLLKALADPIRLKILRFLRSGEKCQCEIIPHLKRSQSTVSEHLQLLVDIGIVESRKDGRKIVYKIRMEEIMRILDNIDELTRDLFAHPKDRNAILTSK